MKMKYRIDLKAETLNDTQRLGNIIGEILPEKSVVTLNGTLAAGKTALCSYICAKRGFIKGFSSPSFTVLNEYHDESGRVMYHMDVYRINDIRELDYIGFPECIDDADILLIEWADMIKEVLPEDTIDIRITCGKAYEERFFSIESCDKLLLDKIEEKYNAGYGD